MPLDVARLRDSDLASDETPEACWAAVLLWAASWHQVPAASIPDNDNWIAKQAGYAQRGKIDKGWKDVRPGALRGWVLCADGRLYHPVVAEKARDAWQAKLEQRWRTECGRIKKHNDRHEGANVDKPTFEEWLSLGCPTGQPLYVPRDKPPVSQKSPAETPSKRKGEGQGQGQGQGDSYSVPDGTDGGAPSPTPPAPPPPTPTPAPTPALKPAKTPEELAKAELWRAAVSLLDGQGMPEPQARAFIGKLVKDHPHGDTVMTAIRNAVAEQPADARSWLTATCQHLAGQRRQPNKQEALEARGDAVVDAWANEGVIDAAA